MEFTEKSPEISKVMQLLAGRGRVVGQCTTCENEDFELRDQLSEREYKISGMCQSCQDGVFEGGE